MRCFFKIHTGWSFHAVSVICTHNLSVWLWMNISRINAMTRAHSRRVWSPNSWHCWPHLRPSPPIQRLAHRFHKLSVLILLHIPLANSSPIRCYSIILKYMLVKVYLRDGFCGFHRERQFSGYVNSIINYNFLIVFTFILNCFFTYHFFFIYSCILSIFLLASGTTFLCFRWWIKLFVTHLACLSLIMINLFFIIGFNEFSTEVLFLALIF